MAYEFEAVGWQDFTGNRYEGGPDDLADTHGVFVHVQNPDDAEDEHYFWAYALGAFEDWAEWWVYIGSLMEMYGMSLA